MEKKKVIIDNSCDIVYSSFYLQGLFELFGRNNVKFGKIISFPNRSGNLIFEIQNKGTKRYAISLADSYKVNESLYEWCDVYGSVNANFDKTVDRFHEKLISLCPSFGIRCFNYPAALFYALKLGFQNEKPIKKQLGKIKRMIRRLDYQSYIAPSSPSYITDNYVFFLSTLWYNDEWNRNDEGVNARRANFIRACKELEEVSFEGGLVSLGKDRSSEGLFVDVLGRGMSMMEYMKRIKRSVLVFNTPAFLDCHGWKLGEYLAMGKCIVSTKLSNDLPAPLEHGKNIHFVENDKESMKEAIQYIVSHPDYRIKLEHGARAYWEQYGSPIASLNLLGIEK